MACKTVSACVLYARVSSIDGEIETEGTEEKSGAKPYTSMIGKYN